MYLLSPSLHYSLGMDGRLLKGTLFFREASIKFFLNKIRFTVFALVTDCCESWGVEGVCWSCSEPVSIHCSSGWGVTSNAQEDVEEWLVAQGEDVLQATLAASLLMERLEAEVSNHW